MTILNPQEFGLNSRVKIVEISKNHFGIIRKLKSRIIMKDGKKIVEQAREIQTFFPNTKVSLIISGPICSKTIRFLEENKISIISV